MTTTLITGANRGIGLALARVAIENGHAVLGTARDPAAATELRDAGARVLGLDVADLGSVEALAGELAGEPIDILVNNAAIYPDKAGIEATDLDAFSRTMETNVRGPIAVTRALLPNLRAGDRRVIATVSSSMGSIAKADSGRSYAYRMSKAAVNMMAKALAAELTDFVCLAVDPGWVRTDMGGAGASISPRESAAGVFRVVDGARAEQTGGFIRYDGTTLPW
ncbi:MAG: SDR family oxidoreductase [Phycisphaeraceae bacterium]|nr:MAG: SDR family oxidoreductase [Phycisphaeraceae bacterium]